MAEDTAVKVKKKKDKGEKVKEAPATAGNDYGLSAPGSGASGSFVAKEHIDDLLLITPTELVEGMVTTASTEPTDAMRASVVILNSKNPAKSEAIEDALIFGRVVVSQLKPSLANRSRVVGTFIEDIAAKKPGRNAPYRLTAPSDTDIQVAKAYLDSLDPLR